MTGISVPDDGRPAGGHGGPFGVEAGRLARLEVLTPYVRHMEEQVLVRVLSQGEPVTAIEEINVTSPGASERSSVGWLTLPRIGRHAGVDGAPAI
jgi:hypothetical protein